MREDEDGRGDAAAARDRDNASSAEGACGEHGCAHGQQEIDEQHRSPLSAPGAALMSRSQSTYFRSQ